MSEVEEPTLGPRTLDVWAVRRAIRSAVIRNRELLQGTLLDVGCGRQPYRRLLTEGRPVRYLGMDLAGNAYGARPELEWDGAAIPLPDASVDSALATEVLEHCPEPEPVLREVARVLRPGGALVLTVPFLYPLHDVPHDFWRFTPFALERLLGRAGFPRAAVEALGGWDAALAQTLGLWVRRRPMPRLLRAGLSFALWPLVGALGARRPSQGFGEGAMVTGLAAVAWKERA
jgi:SAM-dependent methyltransferase